jgi:hypothetical protein
VEVKKGYIRELVRDVYFGRNANIFLDSLEDCRGLLESFLKKARRDVLDGGSVRFDLLGDLCITKTPRTKKIHTASLKDYSRLEYFYKADFDGKVIKDSGMKFKQSDILTKDINEKLKFSAQDYRTNE